MLARTLRALSLLPFASLLAVACGGGDDPAADPPEGGAGSAQGGASAAGQGGQSQGGQPGAGQGGQSQAGSGGGSLPEPAAVACGTSLPKAASGVCDVVKGTSGVVVRGRVVGADKVFEGGEVLIGADGKIACVACDCSASPGYAAASKVACADGVVTPSLINTHDHITFAQAAPREHPGVKYDHRHEWRKGLNGKPKLTVPSGSNGTQDWAELRFVLSGAASIVGSGGVNGMLRNLDRTEPQQPGLGPAAVNFDTFPLGDSSPKSPLPTTCSFDWSKATSQTEVDGEEAYLPHIAEGVSDAAHTEFACLDGQPGSMRDLVQKQTAIIHAVGVQPSDAGVMAAGGTAVIWSPRSNIDLYGFTAPVTELHRAGVQLALGTDWSASGSMNLLRELACADSYNKNNLGGYFSDYHLFRMVTADAAAVTASDDKIGALSPGLFGDVTVWNGAGNTTFGSVVRATLDGVSLVLRGGTVLYGEADLVDALSPDGGAGCEALTMCLSANKLCAKRELGRTTADIRAAFAGKELYDLYFCGVPDKEPSCVPSRPGEFTGVPSADDSDGDGLPNASDLCPTVFSAVRPMDKGAQGDADGDGAGDACDPCPLKANSTDCPLVQGDADGDGVEDAKDNCANAPNADQADADADMKGDACDPCPSDANPGAAACPAKPLTIPAVRALPDGQAVAIAGSCVTAMRSGGSSSFTYWIQDPALQESAGMVVYSKTDLALAIGDKVDVTGTTATFNGLKELTSPAATKTGTGCVITPKIVASTAIATSGADVQKLMSMLVKVEGVSVTTAGDASTTNDFIVTGDLVIDDFVFAYDPASFPVGTSFSSITGVLDYYKDHSKLCPRSAAELAKLASEGRARAEPRERVDHPPVRGPEGLVRAVHREQAQRVLAVAPRLGAQPHEPPSPKILADQVRRQVPPAEPGAEQRVLRVQVGDAPRPRREDRLVRDAGHVALREDELHVLGEPRAGHPPRPTRQRVARRDDGDELDVGERLGFEAAHDPGRPDDAERRRAGEYARRDRGQRLRVDAELDVGQLRRERAAEGHQRRDGHQLLHAQRHGRLHARGEACAQPVELVDLGAHAPRRGEHRLPLRRQRRRASRAVPDRHAELGLEVRHRGADSGLHPRQAPARRGEAAALGRGDQGAELVERDAIEHDSTISCADDSHRYFLDSQEMVP
ncbi:MAG: thrombospondin type 3 repeat-containing protein [Polyangiaceae bacterium]|nr:thrombospondin type 3 repeat-containing protein [Polyangiaceae bacterium]